MARPQRPWFRFYVEAIYDPKLRRLTPAQRWLWVVILAAARQSPTPGALLVGVEPLSPTDLADMSGLDVRAVTHALPLLEKSSMIERDGEKWLVSNWKDRQYESDDVTERTRKHRSREQVRNVPTAFPGTPPEAEAEPDIAASNTYTHDPPVENPAAALIEEALNIIADRRVTVANGRVANVAAYKASVVAGLRQEHHKQLAGLARDPVIGADPRWTAVHVANIIDPQPEPARTDFAPGSGRIPNWSKGET